MKKFFLLLIVSIFTITASAQQRKYLLHTDANVSRLKEQIKNNPEVKKAWENQLQKAEDILKKE